MRSITHFIILNISLLSLVACDQTGVETSSDKNVASSKISDSFIYSQRKNVADKKTKISKKQTPLANTAKKVYKFKTMEWIELMPKDDLDALSNPPSYITDIEDGSIEDQIASKIQTAVKASTDDRYQQALSSTRVIPELNDTAIRIPGFIVPLEFNDQQAVTQFFLVPFFGACIHVPPPPPNQMIFVTYPEGIVLENLYDPYWISGILQTSIVKNTMATAAYSMQLRAYEKFE